MTFNKYSDPILRAYIELIEAKRKFNAIYIGDPIVPPPGPNLPALIIEKTATRAGVVTNMGDGHEVDVIIRVITSVLRDLKHDTQVAPGVAELYDILEGRNDDMTLKETSLLSIIRSNKHPKQNLITDLESLTEIEHGQLQDREEGAWTTEAQIKFTANFIQLRQT